MQLHFLALLLSASSLALPTENAVGEKSSNGLTKRAHFAWVGEYAPDDWGCTNGEINGIRPEVETGCVPLTVGASNYFGINWGSFPLGISDDVEFYSDNNCRQKIGELSVLYVNNTNTHGVNTCVMASWYGGAFGSVSALGEGNNH